jgi:uncharacterized membrane protein
MTDAPKRRNPLWRLIRAVRTRPRLLISIAVGLVAAAVLPWEWRGVTRALVAWDVAAAFYLVAVALLMRECSIATIRKRAAAQDEGRIVIPMLVGAAAFASLGAIVALLGAPQGAQHSTAVLVLAAVTILLSWSLIHGIFALHYAHEYYDANAHRGGGLNFPGDTPPDYWDFVYFSLVIGMTSQVSDVAVTSPAIRRMVTAHGVVSFIFNATLLALTVNIAAGAI